MTSEPLELIEYGLATFRLALMFAKEKGPCNIFERVRCRICALCGGCFTEGVTCLWCWSIWMGVLLALYRAAVTYGDLPGVDLPEWLLTLPILALALSAVGVIMNQLFTKDD